MVFLDYRLRYPTPPNSDGFLDIHPEGWMIWGGRLQQSCPSFLYVATFINFHQFPSFHHLMIVVLEFCCLNTLHFGVLAPHHAATQAVCWSPQGTWRTSVAMPLIQKSWELSPPGDYWRHWNWFTSLWSRTQLMIYQFFSTWIRGWFLSMWRCEDDQEVVSSSIETPPSENTLTCEHLMMSQHEVNQKTGNPKKPMPSCKPLGHDEAPRESK